MVQSDFIQHLRKAIGILTLLISINAWAQESISIGQFMSAQEYKDAGLDKLSPQELRALDRWFNRYTSNLANATGHTGRPGATKSQTSGYVVESAVNDETFVINGNVYKAKTYCFHINRGDRVVFADGSAMGVCTSAKLVNLNNGETCAVWCE